MFLCFHVRQVMGRGPTREMSSRYSPATHSPNSCVMTQRRKARDCKINGAHIALHHKRNGVGKGKTRLKINVQNWKSVYRKNFQILQKGINSERNVIEFP